MYDHTKTKKNCRWHMTTIKSYSNISRFKSIFAKEQIPKLSKDKFCNLECLVCQKLYRKKNNII